MLTKGSKDPQKRANIRDVAKHSGFSVSTVSLALSGHPRISKPTREKVLRVVEELGYVPNVHAKRLFTRKNHVLGVVLASHMRSAAAHALYSQLFFGICSVIRERGYQAMIAGVDETDGSQPMLQMVIERQVDGLMLVGRGFDPEYVSRISDTGLPVLTCPEYLPQCSTPAVVNDNKAISTLSVDHLVGLGHTSIAYLGNSRKFWFAQERKKAFLEAIERHRLEIPDSYVMECDAVSTDAGMESAGKILACKPTPTAVIAANDLVAIGLIKGLEKRGIQVPREVSVIGCDDLELCKYTTPSLTTVSVPWERMGAAAAEDLIERIETDPDTGEERPLMKVTPVSLTIRDSCLPPHNIRNGRGTEA